MTSDKKAQRGQYRFVLPVRLGQAELSRVLDSAEVRSVLRA